MSLLILGECRRECGESNGIRIKQYEGSKTCENGGFAAEGLQLTSLECLTGTASCNLLGTLDEKARVTKRNLGRESEHTAGSTEVLPTLRRNRGYGFRLAYFVAFGHRDGKISGTMLTPI